MGNTSKNNNSIKNTERNKILQKNGKSEIVFLEMLG